MKNCVDCSNDFPVFSLPKQLAAAKNIIVTVDVGRFTVGEPSPFCRAERHFKRVDDAARDVVLNFKDIGQIAVIALPPYMAAACRVYELGSDRERDFRHGGSSLQAPIARRARGRRCGRRPRVPCR